MAGWQCRGDGAEVKDPDDAARGYYLGAQLLDFLAPCGGQETLTVPVSTRSGNAG